MELEEATTDTLDPEIQYYCTTLERDLHTMDTAYDTILEKRSRIIDKLEASVMTMKLDLDKDDAEQIEAKMQAINAYSKLLTDQEKNVHSRAALKLKNKDVDQRKDLAINVSEVIASIQQGVAMPRVVLNEKEREKLITDMFDSAGCVIIEEELVTTSDVSDIGGDYVRRILASGDPLDEETTEEA